MLGQVFVACKYIDKHYEKNYFFYIICVLQMYWTFFTFLYLIRVFVSSVIALELMTVQEEVSIPYESAKNTMYCLGSICFGSLLIAIVTTLRHLQDRSRERGRRSTGGDILYVIIAVILAILQEIIQFINEWTFVYMAIYGKGYVDSIKGAFGILGEGRNSILVNSLCVLPALNVLSIAAALGYIGVLKLMDLKMETIEDYIPVILSALVVFITVDIFFSAFDSATKAFLFTHDREPHSIKNKFPKTYEMMEEQKNKAN